MFGSSILFIFFTNAFIFALLPFISPRKYDTQNPIIIIIIEITELALNPKAQLSFNTFGIIDINKPNIIENVPV